MTNFEMVKEFMNTFGQEVKTKPEFPSQTIINLRRKLIDEEVAELKEGILLRDMENVAKELTDGLVVLYGAGAAFGIDLDACFKEVHASNMSKLGEDGKPIYREDGKVLKGPNYFQADLKKVLGLNEE
jgi:predicted HAD superfamily Cof-like phosphohydrolase